MAVSSFARALPSFECRSDPDFSLPEIPSPGSKSALLRGGAGAYGLSSLILKFPPNFVRQLSVKSRRNCSNIGVAQVVAASWSNNQGAPAPAPAAAAVDAAAAAAAALVDVETGAGNGVLPPKDPSCEGENVQIDDSPKFKYASFLNSDGSVAIHAGERLGRAIATDAITTPVFNTSAYFFKKTADLIDFKEKRRASFEYGRYEEKIRFSWIHPPSAKGDSHLRALHLSRRFTPSSPASSKIAHADCIRFVATYWRHLHSKKE